LSICESGDDEDDVGEHEDDDVLLDTMMLSTGESLSDADDSLPSDELRLIKDVVEE
jgi:hypothetical protein